MKNTLLRVFTVVATLGLSLGCIPARNVAQAVFSADSHITRPKRVDFEVAMLQRVRMPEGLTLSVFSSGLGDPRMMEVLPNGAVLVTRPSKGDVLLLRDDDGDGRASPPVTVTTGLKDVHGIEVHAGKLYLGTPHEVWVGPLSDAGAVGPLSALITGLPEGGQHPKRTLAVGPDGLLYVSVGSSCNACVEEEPDHATMLRYPLDGSVKQVFARGLRNTIGFDWHPQTLTLWGMDHGSDHRGDDLPQEELNLLAEGKDYGWPYAHQRQEVDSLAPNPPNGTKEERAARSEPMVLGHQAHSAPIGFLFYRGTALGERFNNGALVAFRGSWNRAAPAGYQVSFVPFKDGRPVEFQPFATGFLADDGSSHFARPSGLAQLPDGSVLVSDDSNGLILRISRAPESAG